MHHTKSTSTKLPHTQTVYVCHKPNQQVTKHISAKKHASTRTKKKTTTTTTKHSTHKSIKTKSVGRKSVGKQNTLTKKTGTRKTTTTTKNTTTKKTTTTAKKITKKSTTFKPTTTHKASVTSTTEIVVAALPTTADTNSDVSNAVSNDGSDSGIVAASLPTDTAEEPTASAIPVAAPVSTPVDNNNQVNSQSVDNTQTTDATPQSKAIGISIGAVVGCIAAAGLAGMFIYRRRERTNHDQDVEDMNQTSEVNTRWRTQSFMAVVAGAVAKLPKRSNSSASNSGRASFNVLGSIRRAASNASRSLSVRSKNSTRSSVQSYGIAVSGPIPAITRIDGDQAYYSGESESPSTNHHTHAY